MLRSKQYDGWLSVRCQCPWSWMLIISTFDSFRLYFIDKNKISRFKLKLFIAFWFLHLSNKPFSISTALLIQFENHIIRQHCVDNTFSTSKTNLRLFIASARFFVNHEHNHIWCYKRNGKVSRNVCVLEFYRWCNRNGSRGHHFHFYEHKRWYFRLHRIWKVIFSKYKGQFLVWCSQSLFNYWVYLGVEFVENETSYIFGCFVSNWYVCNLNSLIMLIFFNSNYYEAVNIVFAEIYIMNGKVESVDYSINDGSPCYVAIRDESSPYNLYYHWSNALRMCEFAERCKRNGDVVWVRAKTDDGNNSLMDISHGNTEAKWRTSYYPV